MGLGYEDEVSKPFTLSHSLLTFQWVCSQPGFVFVQIVKSDDTNKAPLIDGAKIVF